jgi:3-phosphoglycerate kinase
VRADFNVPLRWPDGPTGPAEVADDFRIRAAMPTLDWLAGRGADVTVCTHLGRPHGQPDLRYDLAPVRERLAELAPGVELLDNLRFDPGEKANDPAFVDRLVGGFDCYVNDAFGVSHRPTPRSWDRRPACRRPPAACWPARSRPSVDCWPTRPGPSWPSWEGPRWPTSSGSCVPCSTVDR